MSEFEYLLFKKINNEWAPAHWDTFFIVWTDIQKTIFFQILICALMIFFIVKKQWRNLTMIVAAALVATLVDSLNSEIIKPFFARPRPIDALGPSHVILRGNTHGSWGFPSSHASVSFCLAIFLGFYFKKALIPLLLLALLTCYSRIYCGVHFPSDVLAGAIFGSFMAYISYALLIRVERRFR